MNENGFQFRTAAIGGFQKQDVMDYLERSARDHTEKLTALQRALGEEKAARAEESDRSAVLAARIASLETENQRLSGDLSDRETRLAQLSAELTQLKALADDLQGQVARLTPSAEAYESIKNRTAGIELEAHGRAQAIEQEARDKAKKCQDQVKAWYIATKLDYDRLRAAVNTALLRVNQELEQTGRNMAVLTEGLDAQGDALAALETQIDTLDGAVKPPVPLPLDDDED